MQINQQLQTLLINPELINVLSIIFDEINNFGHSYPLIWQWDSGELLCLRNDVVVKSIIDLKRMFEYPEYRITIKSHRNILSLA